MFTVTLWSETDPRKAEIAVSFPDRDQAFRAAMGIDRKRDWTLTELPC